MTAAHVAPPPAMTNSPSSPLSQRTVLKKRMSTANPRTPAGLVGDGPSQHEDDVDGLRVQSSASPRVDAARKRRAPAPDATQ
jgi:hypothetical protein